jgi:hypothetical protein
MAADEPDLLSAIEVTLADGGTRDAERKRCRQNPGSEPTASHAKPSPPLAK